MQFILSTTYLLFDVKAKTNPHYVKFMVTIFIVYTIKPFMIHVFIEKNIFRVFIV